MALSAWRPIEAEARRIATESLADIVARRGVDGFVWRGPHLEVDVSRQRIDSAVLSVLAKLVIERGLDAKLADLFAGRIVNASEDRPALHWALRGGGGEIPAVARMQREAARVSAFAAIAASGGLGFDVKTIVHIGIGGSDLGPRLVWDALRAYGSGPEIRFCANVDPDDFREAVTGLDPSTTLFIVVSKSFKTPETASNARLAHIWLAEKLGDRAEVEARLAAVSSAPDRAQDWGAPAARIFAMDEAVGGRYSVWSSVGLSLQIALGADVWRRFLAGAAEMDSHVRDAPMEGNLAARLGALDVWLHSALNLPTRTVLAYAHRLRRLPDFLQQLEMESNGKSVADAPGGLIAPTAPVVWGSVGTLGQHSFHQLLHQGMRDTAVEFVASLDAGGRDRARGRALLANAFGQGEAFLVGRSAASAEATLLASGMEADAAREQARHMHMPGGRGSTTILLDDLSPESVGALLALYEHRTFAAGVLWGVNPFDQWGVERGKVLAEEIELAIRDGGSEGRDPTTMRLIERARDKFAG
ncbi:glucose-6-phosphate isomerase [bacterium]|nr:glucose-6-phosphate isomerase [bacterium]